jgi:DNA polymerase III subunit epsilon
MGHAQVRPELCEQLDETSVSRRTKVVVAADPDSISGKALAARERGVPVITVAAYLKLCEKLRR